MGTDRFCHKLKKIKGSEGPGSFVFFDCETWPFRLPTVQPIIGHKLRLGCAIGVRWEKGRMSRRAVCRFKAPNEFWAFVRSRLTPKKTTWLFAHNLPFDFRLLRGFDVLEQEHAERWRLVLRDPPTVMRGRIDGCPVIFCDSLNYFKAPLESLGCQLGLRKHWMPPFTACEEWWYEYCLRDCEILEQCILQLRSYLAEHDLGTFGRTISQCSHAAWRRRFYDGNLYLHDNDTAVGMERAAYFGGRAEAYRLGRLAGPIYQLDVNSLYPSVMRGGLFPNKLVGVYDKPDIRWVEPRLAFYGGVADVLIDCKDREYPKRIDQRPVYVRGVYRTSLCGAELRSAVAARHVLRIDRIALYEVADLFSGFVDFFYSERQRLKREGNGAWEVVAKSLLNSLAGKFGQKAPRWVEAPDQIAPNSWGHWTCVDKVENCIRHFRAIASIAQEEVEDGEGHQSFPAVSAFVTAAGRERMETLKATAGRENVYYMDTDSLMVSQEGFDRLLLQGEIGREGLGKLKCEAIADTGVIHGIKDYSLGNREVMKGIKKDAVRLGGNEFDQWFWEGLSEGISSRGSPIILQHLKRIRLARKYTRGLVGPDGRVRPHELFEHPDF